LVVWVVADWGTGRDGGEWVGWAGCVGRAECAGCAGCLVMTQVFGRLALRLEVIETQWVDGAGCPAPSRPVTCPCRYRADRLGLCSVLSNHPHISRLTFMYHVPSPASHVHRFSPVNVHVCPSRTPFPIPRLVVASRTSEPRPSIRPSPLRRNDTVQTRHDGEIQRAQQHPHPHPPLEIHRRDRDSHSHSHSHSRRITHGTQDISRGSCRYSR
jgi:hypothetical protein